MTLTIITNNIPRDFVYGHELTDNERKEFDYLDDDEILEASFVRYKGWTYELGQFMRCDTTYSPLSEWSGYCSDSAFSGVLLRYTEDFEQVIMGRYCS